jgi:hypothetical protein
VCIIGAERGNGACAKAGLPFGMPAVEKWPKRLKQRSPERSDKQYLKALRKLQVELCELQEWVKYRGLALIKSD